MTLRMKDVHLVGVARSDAQIRCLGIEVCRKSGSDRTRGDEKLRHKRTISPQTKKGAGGPPLLSATADYFTTGTGTKQSMLVWMRKFDSNVCRSAWKISIGYEVPGTMPSAAAWASKSIEPVSAW